MDAAQLSEYWDEYEPAVVDLKKLAKEQ